MSQPLPALEISAYGLDTPVRSNHQMGSQDIKKTFAHAKPRLFGAVQVDPSEVLSIVCVFSLDNHPELDSQLDGLLTGIVSIFRKSYLHDSGNAAK